MTKWQTVTYEGQELALEVRDAGDLSAIAEIFEWKEYGAVQAALRGARHAVVDVGAHIGAFSLWVRCQNPLVPILALEPEVGNFQQLKSNLIANDVEDVVILNCALAAVSAAAPLYLNAENLNHSLISHANAARTATVSVPTISLSDLITSHHLTLIDLLKLDIEGGEYDALWSVAPEDWQKIQHLILEYHPHPSHQVEDLVKILSAHFSQVKRRVSRFDEDLGFLIARK